MTQGLPTFSYRFLCRNRIWLLAISWILSFLSGMFFSSLTDPLFSSLMCRAVFVSVSIVGLVGVLFFPLFISAVAVYFRSTVLIYLICSFRGFCFGCCLYSALAAFGAGGWLMIWLLLFSAFAFQIVLFWFWLRYLSGTICFKKDLCICTGIAVMIGILDYFCVSPFLEVLVSKL